jgi:preprotein translocase subunit SecF
MQFIKTTNFDFVKNARLFFTISTVLIAIILLSLVYHPLRHGMGLNASIDFTGGTMLQLKFEKTVVNDLGTIRNIINDMGYGSGEVKRIGVAGDNEIQILVKKQKGAENADVGEKVQAALQQKYAANPFELRRQEHVGPRIGSELKRQAIIAALLSFVLIIIYVGFRFNLPFGVASVIALIHDAMIVVGTFSLFNIEFSLTIVAAVLTIIGFSINDTIVIFDRIRENVGNKVKGMSFEQQCNLSINQTLSRTIITTGTVFLVVLILFGFFFRTGDVIEYFAIAMIAGLISGTYSTIFIATPIVVWWNKRWPFTVHTIKQHNR